MKPLALLYAAGLVALTLGSGCSNALLFYETGKVALSLEARPNDASQPVQGSLAFKQRTAAVVPPLKNGDAGAMISSFRFAKEPGFTGPITIQTALITGAAATKVVEEKKSSQVAQAISGAPINTLEQNAKLCVENARKSGAEAALRALVALPYDSLSAAQLTRLGDITGLGSRYRPAMHEAIRAELGS
jgi:hypothetical protein